MARKKRKYRKNTTTKMTLKDRETNAKNALHYGHYKKAITHLKPLLEAKNIESDRKARWIEWAKTAHTSLAQQLFKSKKYQEVIRVCNSGHRLCELALDTPIYITSLINTNRFDEALEYYLQLSEKSAEGKTARSDLALIRSELAVRAIANDSKIIERLPEDDPVAAGFENACELLDAYCHSNDELVEDKLKLISFRSPYRDLKQIISAAIKLDKGSEADKEKSRETLANISPDSAFFSLAEAFQLTAMDVEEIASSYLSLNNNLQAFVCHAKGWQEEQQKLLNALANLPPEPGFSEIFRIADSCKKIQPEYAREIAQMALVHARVKHSNVITPKRYEQRFGKMDALESQHVEALYEILTYDEEPKDDYFFDPEEQFIDVEEAWEDYLSLLNDENDEKYGGMNPSVSLSNALVYRFFVKLRSRSDTDTRIRRTSIHYLEKSLEYDPLDKESHLDVIRYYLNEKKLKDARDSLNLALKYYPDDLQILLLAVEVAIAGNAFKKASNYAKKILEVDPINRQARNLLCKAHLAHARKQVPGGKWHLLEKELDEAEQWSKDQVNIQAAIVTLRAIMATAQKQKKQASEYLQQLSSLLKTDLNASLIIHLETGATNSEAINCNAKKLHQLAKLKWRPAKKQKKEVLFSFIEMSEACLNDYDEKVVHEAFTALKPALKFIDTADFSLQDYESVLAFWHRTKQTDLSEVYVEKAIKEHGNLPLLIYYRYIDKPFLPFASFSEVEDALHRAKEAGDSRTVTRLISVLEKSGPPMPLGGFNDKHFPDFDLDDDFNDLDDDLPLKDLDEDALKILLPELINLAASDKEIISLLQNVVRLPHAKIMEYKDIIGEKGLREMLIAFITKQTEPEDFIAEYESTKEETEKEDKKPKKKSFFSQLNLLFGGDDE